MIDVFELYQDFCSLVNTFQGGTFRFQTDFVRNVNVIYYDIVNREVRNSRKSQESKDNVMAFFVSKNIIIPKSIYDRYAVIPLPKDYFRFSSSRIVISKKEDNSLKTIPDINVNKGKCWGGSNTVVTPIQKEDTKTSISEMSIELIDDAQWSGCLQHLTKFPSLTDENALGGGPKMVQINGSFQIAPKEISVVVFSYYKKAAPVKVSVTYTAGDDSTGAGDEVIYNKNQSTQILLPDSLKDEFLWRLGTIYGFFTREQFVASFGDKKEND